MILRKTVAAAIFFMNAMAALFTIYAQSLSGIAILLMLSIAGYSLVLGIISSVEVAIDRRA